MIRPRLIVFIAVLGVFFVWASTTIHDTWITSRAVDNDHIRQRDMAIAQRDAGNTVRDTRLHALRLKDSLELRVNEQRLLQKLTASEQTLAQTKAALDADAHAHGDLVPLQEVHLLEQHYDSVLMDCKELNGSKDLRIANLLTQGKLQDTTRASMDTTRTQMDSTRHDLEAALNPAWWRRLYGWIADRAPALGVGTVIGVFGTVALRP